MELAQASVLVRRAPVREGRGPVQRQVLGFENGGPSLDGAGVGFQGPWGALFYAFRVPESVDP